MAKPNPKVIGASGASGAKGATGASGAKGASGASGSASTRSSPNTQSVAPTGATGPLPALLNTSYLNTSKPKNYPLVDQPGGKYKPLSDTSRFVFDKSDAQGIDSNNLIDLLNSGSNQQSTGQNISSAYTNRKYFGANKAVVDKLEDVDFKQNYTKPDYIAYLIPYGSPGLSSPSSQTVSTQVPASDDLVIPKTNENGIPISSVTIGDGQKIQQSNKVAFNLFIGASIATTIEDSNTPQNIDNLTKIYTAQWNELINGRNTQQILDIIDQVYAKNYKSYQSIITSNKLTQKPKDYASVISSLKRSLGSLSKSNPATPLNNSKFGVKEFSGITNQDIISTGFKISGPGTTPFSNILNSSDQIYFKNVPDSSIKTTGINPPASLSLTGKSADPVSSSTKKTDPGVTGVDPSLKVWQFLYNPQSITIDVKADYAESNTWGATDDGQSGRSVQWLKNNNPVMRLDEVVLNGFIHNKKVGQLEEGLFALLMSRDGVGQIQPTIWEFVWGKRRFGPCIINNIQVVEKQWEAGEVLSATVSFELTQIPKWQIIDSTVKFYDPTAIGSFDQGTGGTSAGATSGDNTGAQGSQGSNQTSSNRAGGGGTNDPCRAAFNGVIDTAKSKSLSSYLFACSKKTNPPTDLYKEVTDKNVDAILDRLDKQCNSFSGGKTPIISTAAQGEEYKTQGRATLLSALKEKQNCINKNELKGKSVSSSTANNLLKAASVATTYGVASFGLPADKDAFLNNYGSLYNKVSNIFQISDLAKTIDANISVIKYQGGSNFSWPTNNKSRKCTVKTIRDKYFNSIDGVNPIINEVKACSQQIWLVILQEMASKNLVFDGTIAGSSVTNVDFNIEVLLSNKKPYRIKFTTASGFLNLGTNTIILQLPGLIRLNNI